MKLVIRGVSRVYSTVSTVPKISSTLILSRPPLITSDLPEFDRKFYHYQQELLKRLMWTFPKWFYFKEGTLAEQRYRQLNKDPVDNNPDIEFPRGRPEIRHNRDRRFKQEIRLPKTYKEADQLDGSEPATSNDDLARKIVPNSRTTNADEINDQTSLERNLSRTLYLVINENNGQWKFPNFKLDSQLKSLHSLAEDGLININGGEKLNYFNVSNTPCHVYINENEKQYHIKSHILSGQFNPIDSKIKYLWLTKQELKNYLPQDYYQQINHLLNDI